MKKTTKITSVILAVVILLGTLSSVPASAFAAAKYNVYDYDGYTSTYESFSNEYCDQYDNSTQEYIIARWANQYDFYESYKSVEYIKSYCTGPSSLINYGPGISDIDGEVGYDLYDIYAEKLGLNKSGLSDFEKIEKIYYFIGYINKFNMGIGNSEFLIHRRGRCEQVTHAVSALCARAGIECYYLGYGSHQWNIVKLNGKYYYLDAQGPFDNLKAMSSDKGNYPDKSTGSYYMFGSEDEQYEKDILDNIDITLTEDFTGDLQDTYYRTVWYPKHKNEFATEDYKLPETKKGLDQPQISVTATDEGNIIKWKPVKDADWYEVYSLDIGFVDEYYDNINKVQCTNTDSNLVYSINTTPQFSVVYTENGQGSIKKSGSLIHAVDINEKGEYQYFDKGNKNKIYFVIAENANGLVSNTPSEIMNIVTISKKNSCQNIVNADTGETLTKSRTLYSIKDQYLAHSKYKANASHNYVKVKTVRKAGDYTQGADVYECSKCLQRKMVYTKANKVSPDHQHSYDKGTVTKEPTCSSYGVKIYKCSCGATFDVPIALVSEAHKYQIVTESNGTVQNKCIYCGKEMPDDFNSLSITLDKTSFTCNGKNQVPNVIIKDRIGKNLDKKYYSVSYWTVEYSSSGGCYMEARNKNEIKAVGTYMVTIDFYGKYEGYKELGFEIKPNNNPGKWIKSGNRWWYRHADSSYTTNDWEKINGKWYHFDSAGWMQTGWLKISRKWDYQWYYLNASGDMATGWKKVSNTWYYLNSSGAMQTGWQYINGAWYYMNASGAMLTGWQKIGGDWYYMNSSGAMCSNQWIGNYYVNSSGRWVKTR